MQRFNSSTQRCDLYDGDNSSSSSISLTSSSEVHAAYIHSSVGKDATVRQSRLFLLLPCALVMSLWNVVDLVSMRYQHKQQSGIDGKLVEQPQQVPAVTSGQAQPPVIDILSIGSLKRLEYQDSQLRTFGRAPTVRNFVRIDERNDTDASCYTDLTLDQVDKIIDFCAQTEHQSYISQTLRQRLFEPKKHVGWMCAQKRPLDGMYQILQRYALQQESIPDFLFVIDDDTYINMDRLVPDLVHNYPVQQPYAVAGCNFDFLTVSGITFPYGGFGSFITKEAIARLIQPFYCDGRDEHSNLACWRLNINALGEKEFFVPGMSVIDLMQAYGSQLKFTQVDSWKKTGYCLHSDHALAYFINFYHITVPQGTVDRDQRPNDKIRRKYSYIGLAGEVECEHERDECRADHRLCHYTTPQQMEELYAEQQSHIARSAQRIS
jgi:hypothetical protein